jgi:8-oxo-dGTP pyrophosphatase MutT (NUDIX family)
VARQEEASESGTQMPFPARDAIRGALAPRPQPTTDQAERSAAVLVCLHAEEILLVRRRSDPCDKWSGHIGLPGGRYEDGDGTLLATALRETHEELGFHATEEGRLLGPLGTYLARHRKPDDLAIAVFVAEFESRPALTLSEEIAAAHWIGFSALVTTQVEVRERPELVPAYTPVSDEGKLVVWGITYGILERLRALE